MRMVGWLKTVINVMSGDINITTHWYKKKTIRHFVWCFLFFALSTLLFTVKNEHIELITCNVDSHSEMGMFNVHRLKLRKALFLAQNFLAHLLTFLLLHYRHCLSLCMLCVPIGSAHTPPIIQVFPFGLLSATRWNKHNVFFRWAHWRTGPESRACSSPGLRSHHTGSQTYTHLSTNQEAAHPSQYSSLTGSANQKTQWEYPIRWYYSGDLHLPFTNIFHKGYFGLNKFYLNKVIVGNVL